jgi:hypothetical protein
VGTRIRFDLRRYAGVPLARALARQCDRRLALYGFNAEFRGAPHPRLWVGERLRIRSEVKEFLHHQGTKEDAEKQELNRK